jgi:hypothetical protein
MVFLYVPIILICPLVGPCENPYAKIRLEPTNTPISCLMAGGAKAASLSFSPRDGENAMIIIRCERYNGLATENR